MPVAPTMTLAEYCPDLAQWPQRWQSDEQDIAAGQHIVEFLTPFPMARMFARLKSIRNSEVSRLCVMRPSTMLVAR